MNTFFKFTADDLPTMPEPRLRALVVLEGGLAATPMLAANDGSSFDIRVETYGLANFARSGATLQGLDALIIEVDPASPVALNLFQDLARDYASKLQVVAAVRVLTVAATRVLLRSGAADVLPLPFTQADLAAAIEPSNAVRRETAAANTPSRAGRVITFLGARGGSGVTALATQMGILWSATSRVCLIDLDIQFGNAALYLDLAPKLGLVDALGAGTRLDGELLESVSVTHASGLHILAAPADVAPLDSVTMPFVEQLISTATQRYDVVLIDLPKPWLPWSVRALEMSDVSILVTALSVSGLHQTRRQLAVIEANGLTERLKLLVNRVEHPMIGKIDLTEIQSILGRKIDYAVADDAKSMNTAVDLGKPLSKVRSGSRIEKDLKAVIASLTSSMSDRGDP